ncbi:MAG TPA: hypothetical protein VGM07_17110 [Stellaceae bacterium]
MPPLDTLSASENQQPIVSQYQGSSAHNRRTVNALDLFLYDPSAPDSQTAQAAYRRWVLWRWQLHDGKPTKMCFTPTTGGLAKANKPATWGTMTDAVNNLRNILLGGVVGPGGRRGGFGIEFGMSLDDEFAMGGVDLDNCVGPDGTIAPWAVEIIARFGSYAEISPSGTGVKIFFRYRLADRPKLLAKMDGAEHGKQYKRAGKESDYHASGIELYISNRYFTVTFNPLPNLPDELRVVDADTILWVICEAGPRYQNGGQTVDGAAAGNVVSIAGARPALAGNLHSALTAKAQAGRPNKDDDAIKDRSRVVQGIAHEMRREGKTFEEFCARIKDDPRPRIVDWYNEKGVKLNNRQLQRAWDKAGLASTTTVVVPAVAAARPIVQVVGGNLPNTISVAEQHLIAGDPIIFQRNGMVGHVVLENALTTNNEQIKTIQFIEIGYYHMMERFTRAVDFKVYDARSKSLRSIDCPKDVARAYLARVGEWKLPVLAGTITAPTLRPDGSILELPGYDSATGIFYEPGGVIFPTVPQNPTYADAQASIGVLKQLISEFPYVPDGGGLPADISSSRSVAISGMLTAPVRRSLAQAPMHAFSAPTPGSGKTKHAHIASMIATGHKSPIITQGNNQEEMEKALGAALIRAAQIITIDNCTHPLSGNLLCTTLSEPTVEVRVLGLSKLIQAPTNASFFAAGNNLSVEGDATRRVLLSQLDAGVERPELRTFTSDDPVEVIRRDRGKYIIAVLTVLRAFVVAGYPVRPPPLGGYDEWDRLVRGALLWLGEPDPCNTMEGVRDQDPKVQNLIAVTQQWEKAIGLGKSVAAKEVRVAAVGQGAIGLGGAGRSGSISPPHQGLKDALLVACGQHGMIDDRGIGTWLRHNKDKVVNGLRIHAEADLHTKTQRWVLTRRP